jgi:hypothetical protein
MKPVVNCREEGEGFLHRVHSLLVVVPSPPTEKYEDFSQRVRDSNTKEPFNFFLPSVFNDERKTLVMSKVSDLYQ